jgi:hypothetical protein
MLASWVRWAQRLWAGELILDKMQKKVEKVMREYKAGKLKSGSGAKVTSRDQAIAIAMSKAGMEKKK